MFIYVFNFISFKALTQYIHEYIYIYIHMNIYIYMCVNAHENKHTHTYIYMCIRVHEQGDFEKNSNGPGECQSPNYVLKIVFGSDCGFQSLALEFVQQSLPAESIEVLCKVGAYVIKRPRAGHENPSSSQVTWSRYGGPKGAWQEARERAGLGPTEDL